MNLIWAAIRPHIFWVTVIAVGLTGFKYWLDLHDKAIVIQTQVQSLQTQIADRDKQIEVLKIATKQQVVVVHDKVVAAKTPEQQLKLIPELATKPIEATPLPDDPAHVKVDLKPLVEQLGQCKQDAIQLGSCQTELALREQKEALQTKQVDTLQEKKSIFKKVVDKTVSTSKTLGVGGAVVVLVLAATGHVK